MKECAYILQIPRHGNSQSYFVCKFMSATEMSDIFCTTDTKFFYGLLALIYHINTNKTTELTKLNQSAQCTVFASGSDGGIGVKK